VKKFPSRIAIVLFIGLLLLSVLLKYSTHPSPREAQLRATAVSVNAPVIPSQSAITVSNPISASKPTPLLGESILRGYATAGSTPQNDLTLMSRLMDNYTLLVKASAQLPMSANEDWAAAFRGKNPAHERFLPDNHVALNTESQVVDRWQTPLFFHALGGHRFELRSAGPDKKLWTEDDIHRNADGSFLRGAKLNAASLFTGSGQPQSQKP
jgi:hypothetical protein